MMKPSTSAAARQLVVVPTFPCHDDQDEASAEWVSFPLRFSSAKSAISPVSDHSAVVKAINTPMRACPDEATVKRSVESSNQLANCGNLGRSTRLFADQGTLAMQTRDSPLRLRDLSRLDADAGPGPIRTLPKALRMYNL